MREKLKVSLHTELKHAVKSHYSELMKKCGPDSIYGYALFTDDGVSSLGPVANKESMIQVGTSDPLYNYYRYGAVEWGEWDDFGLFDDVNKIIKQYHETVQDDFKIRVDTLMKELLSVLVELESEGCFGEKNDRRFIVICAADSSNETMLESARLLNTAKVFDEYASEFA